MARRSSRRRRCRCCLRFLHRSSESCSRTKSHRGKEDLGPSLTKPIVIGQFAETMQAGIEKGELDAGNHGGSLADDVEDAHRLAVAGRDSYWNCLAREYSREENKGLLGQDFASLVASVCASERQNFRVTL